jgi:hypothetical protein
MQSPKPYVGVEKKFHSPSALMSVSSTTGPTMSPRICIVSFMEPIHSLYPASGVGGTTSATGFTKRVIRRDFLVCRDAFQQGLALGLELRNGYFFHVSAFDH